MIRALRLAALSLLLPVAAGCNALSKLPGHGHDSPPQSQGLPDIYTVTGTTSVDFQVIQPIRCAGSSVRVWVKVSGAADFRELNQYEFKADPNGVGGGGVWFKKAVTLVGNLIVINNVCSAPAGSEYRIESTLTSGTNSARLVY